MPKAVCYTPLAENGQREETTTRRKSPRQLLAGLAVLIWAGVRYAEIIQTPDLGRLSHAAKSPYDLTKVALLLEDRPVPHLTALLLHFLAVVPAEWHFRFVGSVETLAIVRQNPAIRQHESIGKLRIDLLPETLSIKGGENLSQTMRNRWFYADFLAPAENLFVFQTDSMICSNSGSNLNDFLGYDWVGAWWPPRLTRPYGGNGGFNLRKVSTIIKTLDQFTPPKLGEPANWEDLWFCDIWHNNMTEVRMAPREVAQKFSIEGVPGENPLGFHIGYSAEHLHPDVWVDYERRQGYLDYCPELKLVMRMDLVDPSDLKLGRPEVAA